MSGKTIRSHRERVKQANETLRNNPKYRRERISIIDREAFVEFYLLEDILKFYEDRLKDEEHYIPDTRLDKMAQQRNIAKFSAIINVFKASIGAARAAIVSGDYKKVWKAIHEGPLMAAANNVKNLPELKDMAIELLRELSRDMMFAEKVSNEIDPELDELEAHEENVRNVQNLPPTMDEIEEVIRAVEVAIPNKKNEGKLNPNT